MSYRPDCTQCRAIRRPCHRHRPLPRRAVTPASYTRATQYRAGWLAVGLYRQARDHGTPVTGEARHAATRAIDLADAMAEHGMAAMVPEGARR